MAARTVRAVVAAILLVAASACAREGAGARLQVAATIPPLYDIVRSVAAPVADVVLILPPGASPHTFEPTPGLARRLAGSVILFEIGHGLDEWAGRLAAGVGVGRVVTVDQNITLRRLGGAGAEAPRGAIDPHYWLTVANARTIAHTVSAEIERLAPSDSARLRASLAAYLARLDSTDAEIRDMLSALPEHRVATFHDAFGYFAAAYGLDVVATFEPFPGKEPGPRFVEEFTRTVRADGIHVVFTEPQLSTMLLEPIARDLDVSLVMLDPLGGVPGRETYVATMLFNAREISAALSGRAP